MQGKLETFGADVLLLMEEHAEWDSDFTDALYAAAYALGLADSDGDGMFKAVWPKTVLPLMDEHVSLRLYEVAHEALRNEYAEHHITCSLDMEESERRMLLGKLENVVEHDESPVVYWTVIGRVPDQDNVIFLCHGPGMDEAMARRLFVEHLKDIGEFADNEWQDLPWDECHVCLDAIVSSAAPQITYAV